MKKLRNILIWASGASVDIVNKCDDKDITKFVNIGIVVLAVALLGTFSFTIFLTFAFGTSGLAFQWAYYPIGLIWGFIILSIDRAIVSTISKKDSALKTTMKSIPRFMLAIMIGLVVATPAEMFIFKKEIDNIIYTDAKILVEEKINEVFDNQLTVLEDRVKSTEKSYLQYHNMYEDEVLGKKSGIAGKGKRANEYMEQELLHLKEYNTAKDSLESFKKNMADYIDEIDLDKEVEDYVNENIGVEERVLVLYSLSYLHWFISLLFITIEILPLLVKLMSPKGSYDEISDDIMNEYINKSKYNLKNIINELNHENTLLDNRLENHLEIEYNKKENEIELLNEDISNKKRILKNRTDNQIEYDNRYKDNKLKTLYKKEEKVDDKPKESVLENVYWSDNNGSKYYFKKNSDNKNLLNEFIYFDNDNNITSGTWSYSTNGKNTTIKINMNNINKKYDIIELNTNELILSENGNVLNLHR